MKRVTAMILAVIITLCCVIVPVSAADRSKISGSLQKQMDASDDGETIRAIIWLNDPVNKSEVFRQAIRECGYIGGLPLSMTIEEVDAYRAVYNRIVHEQEAAAVCGFIESFGLNEACINETYCLCINANLTKAQITAAASHSGVEGIYYDDEGLPVEPLEPEISYPRYLFEQVCAGAWEGAQVMEYRELYEHKDNNGSVDWILVFGCTNVQSPMPLSTVIGNRVITAGCCMIPFDTGYGIYDVRNSRFVDASCEAAEQYDDFAAVFDERVTAGKLFGDLDGDNAITIIDVTILQRCLVRMREFPADDEIMPSGAWSDGDCDAAFYSDFDRDGLRTVRDVTMIQRYLVGLK